MEFENLDIIHINDLLLRCIIGINPEEREKKQDVIINIKLYADLREAGDSDNIEHTVDYKSIKTAIIRHVEGSEYFLVEKMAKAIADLCLVNERVEAVNIRVDKPGALRFARTVGVEICRKRKS